MQRQQDEHMRMIRLRMEYLQDQLDTQLPRAIAFWSKKIDQWNLPCEYQQILERLQYLFDEEVSIREEMQSGAQIIATVHDIHSPSSQAYIRKDTTHLAELSNHFYTVASSGP